MKTELAKFTIPFIARVLPRPRLFRLLDQTRKSQPIVWIAGPPGSGKTTLVTSYISTKNISCLWYRIDEGDADLASFFYYIGIAATHRNRRKKHSLPNFSSNFFPSGLSRFTRRFFREMFKDQNGPLVVVFDNYHEVPQDSILHRVIREGIEESPPGCHTIIISRTPPSQ